MVAGPNGSGKTSLASWLAKDYSVNFYQMLNADNLMKTARETLRLAAPTPIGADELVAFAHATAYPPDVIALFANGGVAVQSDCVVFKKAAVNTYSVALVTAFFREKLFSAGASFSLETVFSHPSKLAVLKRAKDLGYRTYMYFVATEGPQININRVH